MAQVLHRGIALADPLGPRLDQDGIGQVIGPVLKTPRHALAVLLLLDGQVLAVRPSAYSFGEAFG